MKCPKCDERMSGNCCDEDGEIVCETCGSAFELNYLGIYVEGSNDRIDEGFETEEDKKYWKT